MANPVVTALTSYADELSFNFIQDSVFGGVTAKNATVISGFGNSYKIPYITHSLTIQANNCDITSGVSYSTYAQATMTLKEMLVQKDECVKSLYEYFTSVYMPQAKRAGKEGIPSDYAEYYFATYLKELEYKIDYTLWQGDDVTGMSGILDLYLNTSISASCINTTGTTLTTSNIIAEVNEMVSSNPDDNFGKEMVLFMSPSNFTLYKQALVAANYVNYLLPAQNGGEEGIQVPGFEWIKAVPTNIGSNSYMLLIAKDNLFIGTSAESNLNTINTEYINYNNRVRTSAEFNLGVQVGFPAKSVFFQVK